MRKPSDIVERNTRLYGWVKMLTNRAYIPLVAVYLVEVAHLSLPQIGALAFLAATCSLIGNVPAGYLADRWTRKGTMILAAGMLAVSAVIYAVWPVWWGAVLATVLESFAYSAISGAAEALMHDTLVVEDRDDEYVRLMGRAQSFGLIGNVVLVGLVPMTYVIDKHLPFWCGAVLGLVFVVVLTRLQEPLRPMGSGRAERVSLWRVLRQFVTRQTVVFFVVLGLLSGMYYSYSAFANLATVNLGLAAGLFGWVYAGSSLVGAVCGRFVSYFARWPLLRYALFDVMMGAGYLIAVGVTRNLWVAVVALMLNIGFWRVRSIIYQDQLLRRFGHSTHKATLISVMAFFDAITGWQPLVLAMVFAWLGYYAGFVLVGVVMIATLGVGFVIGVRLLEGRGGIGMGDGQKLALD